MELLNFTMYALLLMLYAFFIYQAWQSPYIRFFGFAFACGAASFFLVHVVLAGLLSSEIVAMVSAYLIAVNLVTLGMYAYDKIAARGTYLRVPELTLHVLGLAGGTPAALLGQWRFRHKTIKSSFRVKFFLIIIFQLLVLGQWLYYANR
jgi:uncharacterized membrane protein YsdA (DUF1294 family)